MTWTERDKQNLWHPFTQMKIAADPIHIERAEGAYLYASDGRVFLDAIASWWVNIHGHGHPAIAKKIAEQAAKLDHVLFAGFTHTPAIELAEGLLSVLPPHFDKVFYSDNGSTAVEVALKMALQYFFNKGEKHKTRIIAFENAYHGDTFGAMSAGGKSLFNEPFQELLFDVAHIPIPNGENMAHPDSIGTEGVLQLFQEIAKTGNVAAFIFEPLVQGSAGMLMYDAESLDKLMAIAKAHNILCIADEVMTGFGRTGKMFASNHLTETPDIICLSKGITGGFLPLGVTACTADIYEAFYCDELTKAFFHGHSYTANPISCAAAVASLEILRGSDCQEQIARIVAQHAVFLQHIKTHPFVKNARQTGTILAIDLNTSEGTSYTNSIKTAAQQFFLDNGILIRPLGNILYLMPPYCVSENDLERVYGVIERALDFFDHRFD
jgi:adenosylmethionine---8-amino-7-oxononanoate aminotransferase